MRSHFMEGQYHFMAFYGTVNRQSANKFIVTGEGSPGRTGTLLDRGNEHFLGSTMAILEPSRAQ